MKTMGFDQREASVRAKILFSRHFSRERCQEYIEWDETSMEEKLKHGGVTIKYVSAMRSTRFLWRGM